MKKLLIGLLVLLMCGLAGAQGWVNGSGSKTASALIYTGAGSFHGIALATDGTNAVTVNVYDGLTATGPKLVPTFIATTSATDRTKSFTMSPPVRFNVGLYVEVTPAGAGTVAYVTYYTDDRGR